MSRGFVRKAVWSGIFAAASVACIFVVLVGNEHRQARRERWVIRDLISELPEGTVQVQEKSRHGCFVTWQLWRPPTVCGISLSGEAVTDGVVEALLPLRALTYLSLSQCSISDLGMKSLGGLAGIEHLTIWGCKDVTDNGIPELRKLRSIQVICILSQNAGMTGKTLDSLDSLERLVDLHIGGCVYVTDSAVPSLAHLKQLHTLDVRGTGVSKDGVSQLRRRLPRTTILSDY